MIYETTINFAYWQNRAKEMSDAEIDFAIRDCQQAIEALDHDHPNVGKYLDQISVFRDEAVRRRRALKPSAPGRRPNIKREDRTDPRLEFLAADVASLIAQLQTVTASPGQAAVEVYNLTRDMSERLEKMLTDVGFGLDGYELQHDQALPREA